MRTHHTKTKGDLGVMAAAFDLTKKGFIVCNPMTEHAPLDLIAYRDRRHHPSAGQIPGADGRLLGSEIQHSLG